MITSLSIGTGGLGRFGNQMFTIAGTIGIATKSGQPWAFPMWFNRDNALFGGEITDYNEWFVNPLPELPGGLQFNDYGYFWGYRDINLPTGNWSIDAHMQDPMYFEHCMPLIRETFRMKDEPPINEYVAVHYRAGDYIDDLTAYHPRQPLSYYEQAMALFPVGTKFMLFSDDPDAAIKMFIPLTERHEITLIDKGHYLEDFKVMKRCAHFVTANSSFSFMAALLGEHPEKKIIQPRTWFGSSAGLTFDGYHKDAIVI
jgi:hypothetical protein